jgi:cell division protein FtsW
VIGIGIFVLVLFVVTAKAFPDAMSNRVDTWISRIENFSDKNAEEGYQVEKAKIAIASGGLQGRGPGKSVQKNFLPQSSSDFIYAIIVEEYGLMGAILVVLMYFLLLFRILIAAKKATTIFATLLIIGVGLPIIFQAVINMAVAVNILPVTGQTLPLISSGGTSIWMTCFAIGIILSVTAEKEKEMSTNEENPLDILHETID